MKNDGFIFGQSCARRLFDLSRRDTCALVVGTMNFNVGTRNSEYYLKYLPAAVLHFIVSGNNNNIISAAHSAIFFHDEFLAIFLAAQDHTLIPTIFTRMYAISAGAVYSKSGERDRV